MQRTRPEEQAKNMFGLHCHGIIYCCSAVARKCRKLLFSSFFIRSRRVRQNLSSSLRKEERHKKEREMANVSMQQSEMAELAMTSLESIQKRRTRTPIPWKCKRFNRYWVKRFAQHEHDAAWHRSWNSILCLLDMSRAAVDCLARNK